MRGRYSRSVIHPGCATREACHWMSQYKCCRPPCGSKEKIKMAAHKVFPVFAKTFQHFPLAELNMCLLHKRNAEISIVTEERQ